MARLCGITGLYSSHTILSTSLSFSLQSVPWANFTVELASKITATIEMKDKGLLMVMGLLLRLLYDQMD